MHPNSKLLFAKYAQKYFKPNIRVLEIGPDKIPSSFQNIVGDDTIIWDTLDLIERPNITYYAHDEYQYPIANNSYDIVLSVNVLEHVRKIWIWLQELSRVCKKSGLVITR